VLVLGEFTVTPKRGNPQMWLELIDYEYTAPIGLVITQWSMMERMIESNIWRAAGFRPNIGLAVTSQTQVQGKLDMLGALLAVRFPLFSEPFTRIATYIRERLLGQRNLVAHGFWVTRSPGTSAHKTSAKGKLVLQTREFTLSELGRLAYEIAEVTAWLDTLGHALPLLPKPRGALDHKMILDAPPRPDYTSQKQRALQPLARPRRGRPQKLAR
jgi:hypothetical protein